MVQRKEKKLFSRHSILKNNTRIFQNSGFNFKLLWVRLFSVFQHISTATISLLFFILIYFLLFIIYLKYSNWDEVAFANEFQIYGRNKSTFMMALCSTVQFQTTFVYVRELLICFSFQISIFPQPFSSMIVCKYGCLYVTLRGVVSTV